MTHPTSGTVDVLRRRIGYGDLRELRGLIGRHLLREAMNARDVVLTGFTGTSDATLRWQPNAAELARPRLAPGTARHLRAARGPVARFLLGAVQAHPDHPGADRRATVAPEPPTGSASPLMSGYRTVSTRCGVVAAPLQHYRGTQVEESPSSTTQALLWGGQITAQGADGALTSGLLSRVLD